MRDEYALDRRANALYDAAMRQRQTALRLSDQRHDAITQHKAAALYAQELGAWRKYDALITELNGVYAEIRAWNLAEYSDIARRSLEETLARQSQPLAPRFDRLNNQVLAILHRDGKAKAAGIVRELKCGRTGVYESLRYLQAWGYIRGTTRGVFELIQDESA